MAAHRGALAREAGKNAIWVFLGWLHSSCLPPISWCIWTLTRLRAGARSPLGVFLGFHLILLLIVIMGGRVIPFFTERALQGFVSNAGRPSNGWSPSSVIAFMLPSSFSPELAFLGGAGLRSPRSLTAFAWASWYNRRYWQVPLLWVLHLGYAWIVAGFVLKSDGGFRSDFAAVHDSCIHRRWHRRTDPRDDGARRSRSHRQASRSWAVRWSVAFALLNLAAIGRGLLPIFFPLWFPQLIIASGALWIAAFLIFVVIYTPILTQPRIDGQPG